MQRRDFLGLLGIGVLSNVAYGQSELSNDIWLTKEQVPLFTSVLYKLQLVERTVGHANFNLISLDETLKIAKNYPNIEPFSPAELAYIEEVFYTDPIKYGFYGKKTIENMSDTIDKKEVIKIGGSGHYVFREYAPLLERLVKDVGNTLILTSGVRSMVKQLCLHLEKIEREKGNITLATHSLVPPAYSYHSIGDFDVGKKGWGHQNFTSNFARTEEFWQLQKLSYVSMRYTIGNGDGVRFEPWHIKIVS
ncbi:M15 family metallopeptidase [Sulfurospirillum deleyianum]|uniref:Peptidase M15B and M15C DD-carboxypeptidase VanY/endolysin n=1 Tax=Sulfurospirillum deleyianum (strain ATCC 51133 / DSM 6946 / 5175) TaxID=525898 RepID=D1B583_SULD5|nr:M15 family metallopeptidase [Sulfurospirillum deleyianum]ACZ13253.1 peptidase M15B and M15C DD-carboxypeptidase VanY/endolysin [Sulfurospirillum deleyianum DSM 6946]